MFCTIKEIFFSVYHKHLLAISSLRDLFSKWISSTNLSPPTPDAVPSLPLLVPVLPVQGHHPLPPPRVVPLTRVDPPPSMNHAAPIAPIPTLLPFSNLVLPTPSQPVAHQTRSRLAPPAHTASHRKYPSEFINNSAVSLIDTTTYQTLEHHQLFRHSSYKEVWSRSYSNKNGRLCQGVGSNPTNTGEHVKGTNTFKVICYINIHTAVRRSPIP